MLTRTWTDVADAPGLRVRVSGGTPGHPADASPEEDWTGCDEQTLVDASLAGRTGAF